MKFRKLLCILLTVILLLAGCSSDTPQEVTETEAPTQPEPSTTEAQLSLLMSLADTWCKDETDESGTQYNYYYAVTDLDQNGRLEITAALTQGTGVFTYGTMYEVDESFDGLEICWNDEEVDLPEITVSSVPAAYDADSGCYDYLFTNTTNNGSAESYESIQAIRLQDGTLTCTALAHSYTKWIDAGQEEHEYAVLSEDTFLTSTASEYNSVISDYQADRQGFTASLEWFTFESEVNEMVLAASLKAFQASLDALAQ